MKARNYARVELRSPLDETEQATALLQISDTKLPGRSRNRMACQRATATARKNLTRQIMGGTGR